MKSQPRWRFPLGLIVGLAAGLGFALAHVSGALAPFYHAVGLHALVPGHGTHDKAGPATSGHAGHGGMIMPSGKGEPSTVPGYSVVTIAPERQQRIGVRLGQVERGTLLMSVRAVGVIEPDQTRLKLIQTRINGWVTKVHVNFVGEKVKRGDPLLDIYSPDLLSTQEEYLLARENSKAEGPKVSLNSVALAARRRLELWGVPADEIRALEKTKKARDVLTLRAPITGRVLERKVLEGSYVEPSSQLYRIADLSVVWLQAKVYEYELPHVEANKTVHFSLLSEPGKKYRGKVAFIEPFVDETTRTVKVRVAVPNPKELLKPGTYADLKIDHDMGQGLLIPDSAVLQTGERALAFRALPESRFEPVQVTLGSRFGDRFEVKAGLAEGDTIVTSATFLIDAESRLKSAVSMPGGHHHSSPSPQPSDSGHDQGHGEKKMPAHKGTHVHEH
jgi:Cu(I)/Ag(I) efflux system membrane fusion protein